MALVRRPQFAAGVVLFLIGVIMIGLGLPLPSGASRSLTEPTLTAGVSVTIVGAVLAVFGYSK